MSVKLFEPTLEWDSNGSNQYPVVELREVVEGQVAEPVVLHSDYVALQARCEKLERVAECANNALGDVTGEWVKELRIALAALEDTK